MKNWLFGLVCVAIGAAWVSMASAQILTFDFSALAGDEATADSNANDPNLAASTISRGAGLTPSINGGRFNAVSWALTSIDNAVMGEDFIEFTITPKVGFQFDVNSIEVQWQRSWTGNSAVSLRSSRDNYASDLGSVWMIADVSTTQSYTWTFSQGDSGVPVTYRMYSYAESVVGHGGPGDGAGNDIVVYGSTSMFVTNLVAAQRPGTKLVDITYDIVSDSTNGVPITFAVASNGVPVPTNSASGDYGSHVLPGQGKAIVWNMGTDWNGNFAELSFMLTAQPPDYMVVDLTVGPAAANYPISYLAAVPGGVWTDMYKTTNLVIRRIPAGSYTMGSPSNELGRSTDETPHSVTLTKDYYIGVFEVTQKQWERVMGNWPSYFTNATYRDTRPVEMVRYSDIRGASAGTNWPTSGTVDANSFMGLMRSKTGLLFDLPTEAQWEYACRAGTATALNTGLNRTNSEVDAAMDAVGRYWYNGGSNYTANGNTDGGTAKAGSYLPNAWGIYDMHGNAWEWCLDWYGIYSGAVSDPKGATSGSDRVGRGCSWAIANSLLCRSAYRDYLTPGGGGFTRGFRIALPASQTASANADMDSRAYRLTVVSARAVASPPVGAYSNYCWRSTITASVGAAVGYTQVGWTGTGSIPATGVITNTGPIVLTDLVSSITWNWTTNAYMVTFDAQGGTPTDPGTKAVTYATAYGELPTTSRDYHYFAGWWTAPTTGSMVVSDTTMGTASNHTLYARWTIYTYPVALHPGLYGRIAGANSNQSYVTTRAHGSAFPAVTIVPHAGYSFTGWAPAAPGSIVTNFEATAQYVAVSPPTYDVGVGSISITNSGNYIITGSTLSNTISVATGIQANITLINVSVVLSNGCAFHINGGASVNLTLLGTGTNRFTSRASHAGIHLAADTSLSIASNSMATLIAQGGSGGAGIGGGQGGASGSIAVYGGAIQATGGINAAGIGGGSGGSCNAVVVEGAAEVFATGGDYGPGIGSGYGGTANFVSIGGNAVIQAQGGRAGGAGIGGGQNGGGGTILIGGNASIAAAGGLYSAGIGGGSGGGGGNVTIGGNAVVVGTGGEYGAGIGGGLSGAGGTVLIVFSSTVTATGASGGAGIGGGFGGAGGTVGIYAQATIRSGADEGSAAVVGEYGGEVYVHITHISPSLAILPATGGNFAIGAATNGYSGYAVEGADCSLLPGGAWGWTLITNFSINPDGSISVPLEDGDRRVIRLKLTP